MYVAPSNESIIVPSYPVRSQEEFWSCAHAEWTKTVTIEFGFFNC